MGLRAHPRGMKIASVQQPLSMEASPSPLSSRLSRYAVGPEWSWACGPPKGMKNAFCPATALHGSVALPFVTPTEWAMGLWPTQGG
jgi:hypothetical protein